MSESSQKALWPTALAVIGVFAMFLIIVLVARTPSQPLSSPANVPEEEQWKQTDEGRRSRLLELRGRENSALQGYVWADQSAGVVRLPIERAIELTIADVNAQRNPPPPKNR